MGKLTASVFLFFSIIFVDSVSYAQGKKNVISEDISKDIALDEFVVTPSTASNAPFCGANAKAEDHRAHVGSDSIVWHCVCNSGTVVNGIAGNEFMPGSGDSCKAATKPEQEEVPAVAVNGSSCLSQIRSQIRSCVSIVQQGQSTCDTRSTENEKYMGAVDKASNAATQMMHTSGYNTAAAEKCRVAGLLSATSKHALGNIQNNCSQVYQACKNSCDSLNLNSAQDIIAQSQCGQLDLDPQDALEIQAEANELYSSYAQAHRLCSQSDNSIGGVAKKLANYGIDLGKATVAAAVCECKVGINCPLPDNCVTNPNSAQCLAQNPYPNCYSSEGASDPRCKCLINPSDLSCRQGVSQMASHKPNLGGTGLGALGTLGSGSNIKAESSFDAGDFGDESNRPRFGSGEGAAGTMKGFESARLSGGGGGMGGGSGGSSEDESGFRSGEEDAGASKGIAGVFKSLGGRIKNALGMGGSSSSANIGNKDLNSKNKKIKDQMNSSLQNKLRTIATADGYCVVQKDNSKVCFGRKQTSIFEQINRGYLRQRDTLYSSK